VVPHRAGGPEQLDQRHRERLAEHQQDEADDEGQPQPLHGLVGGALLVTGPEQAGDGRRGAVGQEDEQRVADQQDAAGDGQPGELVGPEVAHHRGVGEDVERLGDQRTQRGQREAEDLLVVGVTTERRPRDGVQATSWRLSRRVA
jgi:hypothetical protein